MESELTINKHNSSKALLYGLKNLRLSLSGLTLEQFVINTLETLMYMERDEYLAQLKAQGETNKANGTYPRSFKSLSRNSLIINVPRTRNSDFKPFVLEFLKYNQEQVNDLVLTLYRKGLTTRDVSDVLKNFFGEEISYSQVSNLAESFNELRQAWENTKLETHYKVAFCDAIYITVKRDKSYAKEPVHIIYGVRDNNKRELLDLAVNPTESANSWGESFQRLSKRGIKQIDLIVADGLQGLEDEVHKHFPGAIFQKCVVHKMRNILNCIRPKEKQAVADDLKELFNNFDKEASIAHAMSKKDAFIIKWQAKYPDIAKFFKEEVNEYYFNYIQFPCQVRKMIYTTNSIEALNKKIRKATKNKQSFEKTERLLDYLFVVIKDFEAENWMKYPVTTYSHWTQLTQPI